MMTVGSPNSRRSACKKDVRRLAGRREKDHWRNLGGRPHHLFARHDACDGTSRPLAVRRLGVVQQFDLISDYPHAPDRSCR